MGGAFVPSNLALYGYAHQNPATYLDPDGNWIDDRTPEGAYEADYIATLQARESGSVTPELAKYWLAIINARENLRQAYKNGDVLSAGIAQSLAAANFAGAISRLNRSNLSGSRGGWGRASNQASNFVARRDVPVLPGGTTRVSPDWGRNRLVKELHGQGYILDRPTRGEGGLLYRNPATSEEIRIMPRPSQRFRNDPPAKHESEFYYRYRSGPDQPWGPHTSIPDR